MICFTVEEYLTVKYKSGLKIGCSTSKFKSWGGRYASGDPSASTFPNPPTKNFNWARFTICEMHVRWMRYSAASESVEVIVYHEWPQLLPYFCEGTCAIYLERRGERMTNIHSNDGGVHAWTNRVLAYVSWQQRLSRKPKHNFGVPISSLDKPLCHIKRSFVLSDLPTLRAK
jgi:hypothetical protein